MTVTVPKHPPAFTTAISRRDVRHIRTSVAKLPWSWTVSAHTIENDPAASSDFDFVLVEPRRVCGLNVPPWLPSFSIVAGAGSYRTTLMNEGCGVAEFEADLAQHGETNLGVSATCAEAFALIPSTLMLILARWGLARIENDLTAAPLSLPEAA